MKFHLSALLVFISTIVFAQNFHDTQGKLEIYNSGQASYTLPIAMPPSIKGVGPIINLIYSSGQQSGIAGQGWSINSISTISRMATRFDIDGYRDGVDFDDNDKLALDGQRLLLKSGNYWADGSVYETEVQSNSKIELKISGTAMYFIVTSPDGSRSWYGNYGGMDATDATAFYITRFEDTNGNFMTYHYSKPFNKSLCITEIKSSANTLTNPTPLNKIVFTYKAAARTENAFIKGTRIEKGEILDKIEVYTNNSLFRVYQLTHTTDGQGYQRVTKVQEFNSNLEPANPVTFEYKTTPDGAIEKITPLSETYNIGSSPRLSGDFDGDGRLDFIQGSTIFTNLFQGVGTNFPMNNIYNWGRQFTATTLNNGKLNQKQSLVNTIENTNNLIFEVYNLESNGLVYSYSKNINYNNYGYCYNNCVVSGNCTEMDDNGVSHTVPCYSSIGCSNSGTAFAKNSNEYIEGDFNGDGISEVIILGFAESKSYGPRTNTTPVVKGDVDSPTVPVDSTCFWTYTKSSNFTSAHLVDLNPSSATTLNSNGYYNLTNASVLNHSIRYAMDFNGDGKCDILAMDANGTYSVVSFKQLTAAPWIELEVIGQGQMDAYSTTKQILFGDYNGDGKTDIMMPDTEGGQGHNLWHIYFSNPNPAGGNFFTKESHNIVEYWPSSGATYTRGQSNSSYYALDVNKDGKSDLVRIWLNRYYPNDLDPYDYDTQWIVTAYTNNLGRNGVFDLYYSSGDHYDDNPVVPIPVVSSFKYLGMNTDILMVRPQINFARTTTYISFPKNFADDNLLGKVTQSEGAIVDEIDYKAMESEYNNGYGFSNSFYSSTESLNYPLVEIKKMPSYKLVYKLSNTSLGVTKFQDFAYHGYALDMSGLGSIGFTKTARSSWYVSDTTKKIWNVYENNPVQRGATIRSYSQRVTGGIPFSFDFYNVDLISKTENTFAETRDPVSKRYAILLNKQKATDILNNTIKEKTYDSYSSDYLLPTSETTTNYQGLILQGTTTTVTDYDTAITGTGSNYYIGRPKQVTTTTSAYGNTQTSTEKYFYTAGNLTRSEKNANNDAVTIMEEYDYFSNGLLKSKTISATGTTMANAVSPRSTSYTYDATNRFVKTTTDAEGMVTTNNTFDPIYGQVLSQTNPLGLVTTGTYDNWGKPTKTTDFLGKSITTTYTKAGGIYTTTQTGDDGSASLTEIDALARPIRKGTKDFAGNWNYVKTEYDDLGNKLRDSQPYAETGAPSQWTSYEYDDYKRPIKTTEYTGKIVTTNYYGLTVTVNDEVMTKSKTMNANGHVVSTTDMPGGTVTFKYDAAGNLLESNYDGIIITTEYDAWGRKTKLTDTSAGTYTYSYNAYGELLTETTPKGTTTYTLSTLGKPLTKRVVGLTTAERTDILSTYSYDATNKWLTRIDVTNPYDGNSSYTYGYDTVTKQVNQTVETLPYATFTKNLTFDAFGRVANESSTGVAHGKTTSKTITHSYKNGFPWQLLDAGTVLWQADSFNTRGQLTGATLGNGISITNSYDNYGYATENKHSKTGTTPVPVMTLQTSFEPKKGNLINRYTSLFDTKDDFQYDSLDRLVQWKGDAEEILKLPFNAGLEGFAYVGTATAKVVNSAGVIQVTTAEVNGGIQRQILTGAVIGRNFRIKGDFMKTSGTGNVHLVVIEQDPSTLATYTQDLGVLANGKFNRPYVTTSYSTLKIKFIIDNGDITKTNAANTAKAIVPVATGTTFTLDNIVVTNITSTTQAYDDRGRITQNSVGTYNYANTAKPYQHTSVTPVSTSDQAYYAARGNLNITYNAFKAPVQIEEIGKDKLSFAYNAMEQRSAMYYGSTATDILARPYRKYYSADGSIEVKYTLATGAVEFITYAGGTAYNAPLVIKSDGTTPSNFYLHRDYQGSILAITNATGAIVEKRQFDVWGSIVNVQDGAGNNLAGLTFFDRGYTGHEHLQSVGLINMNARLYDPKLHRFLQPDTYVQDPYNTQNYNRYGYCVNNPTKYTDVTGNVFGVDDAIIIGAAIGIASYFATTYMSGQPITLEGVVKAAFIGAVSGAVTFGIGEWAQTIGNFYLRAGFQALAHGTFQGTMSGLQGGSFWQGFASGAIASIASSAFTGGNNYTYNQDGSIASSTQAWSGAGKFSSSTVGTLAFGTVSGGAGASLTGGNFWQGAAIGLMVSGLNHLAHSGDDKSTETSSSSGDCKDCPKKGSVTNYNSSDGNTYSYGLDGAWHLVGPTLISLGADIVPKASPFAKAIFRGSRVVGEASKTTSVASLTLRKVLPLNTGVKILGTKTLGGILGRFVPYAGWALTVYDVGSFLHDYRSSIHQGMTDRSNWIQQGLIPVK